LFSASARQIGHIKKSNLDKIESGLLLTNRRVGDVEKHGSGTFPTKRFQHGWVVNEKLRLDHQTVPEAPDMSDGNTIARARGVHRSVGPPDSDDMFLCVNQSFYIQGGINVRAQLGEKLPGPIMAPV
jgi:hypothetical protein